MENLHVMKSGFEEAGRSKVLTHHSGYLQDKRWNRGNRGKVLGELDKKKFVMVEGSGGRASEGGWRFRLPVLWMTLTSDAA